MRNENAKVYELAENDIWAGSTSAEYFMRMIGDLIPLLTQRESGQRPMAAKQFAPEEFRSNCALPRGIEQPALFTLQSLSPSDDHGDDDRLQIGSEPTKIFHRSNSILRPR